MFLKIPCEIFAFEWLLKAIDRLLTLVQVVSFCVRKVSKTFAPSVSKKLKKLFYKGQLKAFNLRTFKMCVHLPHFWSFKQRLWIVPNKLKNLKLIFQKSHLQFRF